MEFIMETRLSKLVWAKVIILYVVLALFFFACSPPKERSADNPRYVFLFIGDGMGQPQISATEIYANSMENQDIGFKNLSFSDFPVLGRITTYTSNSYFTDSAASGTALAAGYKTRNGRININSDGTHSFVSVAEAAQAAGRKIGILSSVSLDHATPACFFAQVPFRGRFYDISIQMAQSGFEFFGGGGLKFPSGRQGLQPDARELARKHGYTIIETNTGFADLTPGSGKIWAFNQTLTRENALPYEIDRPADCLTLADFTRKAITLLDNNKGFFMMVEGGKIDWACHDNDAASTILEVQAFSDAVQEAIDFYQQHPQETLIVVTADHETGGMTLGSKESANDLQLNLLSYQKISLDQFNHCVIQPYLAQRDDSGRRLEDLYPEISEKFGLIKLDKAGREVLKKKADDGDHTALDKMRLALSPMEWRELETALADPRRSALGFAIVKILNEKAGISWGSYNHSASPVPVYALGAGADQFAGSYDNTDISKKLFVLLGLSRQLPVKTSPGPPPLQ
jgi:alkaline phosphatase